MVPEWQPYCYYLFLIQPVHATSTWNKEVINLQHVQVHAYSLQMLPSALLLRSTLFALTLRICSIIRL